mmetsp:Transcript_177/g.567  ORF Transcript_177/g.567 Transcript_177/m.567 type:complete len:556 (-) Transcript_177:68-1735(-)
MAAQEVVLRAVEGLHRQGVLRVTLGDLLLHCEGSKVSASQVREEVYLLAESVSAALEVSKSGAEFEVAFVFPRRCRGVLLRRSSAARFRNAVRRSQLIAFSVFRIVFGFFLIFSIVLIVLAIVAITVLILLQSRGGARGSRGRTVLPLHRGDGWDGGGGGGYGYRHFHRRNYFFGDLTTYQLFRIMWLTDDLRYWQRVNARNAWRQHQGPMPSDEGARSKHGDPSGGGDHGPGDSPAGDHDGSARHAPDDEPGDDNVRSTAPDEQGTEKSFFEAVFAFVFGDGDPNRDMETRRWREIGRVIRENGGVIYAEQVAPLLDAGMVENREEWSFSSLLRKLSSRRGRDSPADHSRMHEGYVLGVLTRYGGHAEATSNGQLIYVFPALQVTAMPDQASSSNSMLQPRSNRKAEPILEREHKLFWTGEQLPAVLLLGGVNLVLLFVFVAYGGLDTEFLQELADGGASILTKDTAMNKQDVSRFLLKIVLFADALYPYMMGYALLFFALPCARALWLLRANHMIRKRNRLRQARALELTEAEHETSEKQMAASMQQGGVTLV